MAATRSRNTISAICVVVALIVAAMLLLNFIVEQKLEEEDVVETTTYQMGEWVDLDNYAAREKLKEYDTDAQQTDDDFYPLGNWDGTLRVRIDSVELFDSPKAAGIKNKDILIPSYLKTWEKDGESLCLVTYTVENVDAKPVKGYTKSGRKGFLESFIHLAGIEMFDTIYFDGMIKGGDPDVDANVFYIAPGESRTFQSGIVVQGDTAPYAIMLGLWNSGLEVAIDCQDKRSSQ